MRITFIVRTRLYQEDVSKINQGGITHMKKVPKVVLYQLISSQLETADYWEIFVTIGIGRF